MVSSPSSARSPSSAGMRTVNSGASTSEMWCLHPRPPGGSGKDRRSREVGDVPTATRRPPTWPRTTGPRRSCPAGPADPRRTDPHPGLAPDDAESQPQVARTLLGSGTSAGTSGATAATPRNPRSVAGRRIDRGRPWAARGTRPSCSSSPCSVSAPPPWSPACARSGAVARSRRTRLRLASTTAGPPSVWARGGSGAGSARGVLRCAGHDSSHQFQPWR